MSKKVFHHFDEALFKGVDNLKSQPQFSQASSALEGLPDEYQKYINQGLTYLISFFPFLILLIMFIITGAKHSAVEKKEELIQMIGSFNSQTQESQSLGGSLVGRTPLPDENALRSKLSTITSTYGLKRGALKVTSSDSTTYGQLIQMQATIVFSGLSTPKFLALLETFSVTEKAKILDISIKKNKETVEGEFTFLHYSRGAVVENEKEK